MTPTVVAAAGFTAIAALASVAFVAARGGLAVPLAPTAGPGGTAVAVALPTHPSAVPTAAPTIGPTTSPAPGPTLPPLTPSPSSSPAPATQPPIPTLAPGDPLAALPGCPDHPGCYVYAVQRGDSYTLISDRFGVLLWIMDALNPEVTDKGLLVVGQAVYLGHDPMARLDLCRDGTCRRYVVRSGESLSTIAARYGLTVSAIKAINPELDPAHVRPGDRLRLPFYEAP